MRHLFVRMLSVALLEASLLVLFVRNDVAVAAVVCVLWVRKVGVPAIGRLVYFCFLRLGGETPPVGHCCGESRHVYVCCLLPIS